MDGTDIELLHDMRLQLQLIQSSAELIRAAREDATLDAGDYIETLLDSAGQLRQMLDEAMLRRERALPKPAPLDVAACLRGLCLRCGPEAERRGVALRCRGGETPLWAHTQETALCRIVTNLILNALKAAPRGGQVELAWRALGDYIEISVCDDGCGIPPERLAALFRPGGGRNGHGYGLPSAQALARRLGGTLACRSSPGRGAAFALRLPVRPAELSAL